MYRILINMINKLDFYTEEEVTTYIRTPGCLKSYINTSIDADQKYLQMHFGKKYSIGSLRMSRSSIFTSSFYDDSEITSKLIKKAYPTCKIITDVGSGSGSNTFSFSRHFNKVNAVEFDSMEYQRLLNNINVLNIKNVSTIEGDYINICDNLSQDVVFIDPNWGGPKYELFDKLILCLSDLRIDDITSYILNKNKAKIVVLKTPGNVWLSELKYPYKKVDLYRNMKPFYTLWFVSNIKIPELDTKIILDKICI